MSNKISEKELHRPIVIMPDNYLHESWNSDWKDWLFFIVSIVAIVSSLMVYFMGSELPTAGLLYILRFFMLAYIGHLIYVAGQSSAVGHRRKTAKFWSLVCYGLTSHNIGWITLWNRSMNIPWPKLLIGFFFLLVAAVFFLKTFSLYGGLTSYERVSVSDWKKEE